MEEPKFFNESELIAKIKSYKIKLRVLHLTQSLIIVSIMLIIFLLIYRSNFETSDSNLAQVLSGLVAFCTVVYLCEDFLTQDESLSRLEIRNGILVYQDSESKSETDQSVEIDKFIQEFNKKLRL